jgi:hypothetical protein
LGLDLVRAEVEDWWETNNASREEAIDVSAAATAGKFKV